MRAERDLLYPSANALHAALELLVGLKKMSLTSAELSALKSVLRHGEAPLEFIATAINSEIARREGQPRRGLKAARILVTPQHGTREELRDIEIIADVRTDD